MKGILTIALIISMLVEMAVLFDAFHKRHAGETVFYTGSYLDMKTSIAGKDLGDALRVTVVLNVILFVLFKIIGGIMMRLLNLVLIVLHFALLYGGILLCIYYVLGYRKAKQEGKQLLADWNHNEATVWDIKTLLIHQEQEEKEKREAEAKGENWDEIVSDPEKSRGLILLTEKEKEILENYPEVVEDGEKYHEKDLRAEDCIIRIVAAVFAIAFSFLVGHFQGKLSTQIKMSEGGGDLSYEERVEAYGFSLEDAAFMEGYAGWKKSTVLQAMSDKIFADNLEAERKSYASDFESVPIEGVKYRTPEMVIAQEGAIVYDGPGDSYEQLGVVPYHVGVGKIDPYEEVAGTYDESEWMFVYWWDYEGISSYESTGWIRVKDVKEIS